jgi:hypothetical protein
MGTREEWSDGRKRRPYARTEINLKKTRESS